MLENDYPKLLASLIAKVEWQIELPPALSDFFKRSGYATSSRYDVRRCPRMLSRHKAVLYYVDPLPAFPREDAPVGIYTTDLSRSGFGFLCRHQLFPGEGIRILLPNCWMEAKIARGRRLGPRCFEAGAVLTAVHTPKNAGCETPLRAGADLPA